jgi:hypothetical protein
MSIIIDGTTYDVPVLSIVRRADFLDKYAERTADGVLHRELIGVYFNYQIKFGMTTDTVKYAALWDKLTEPVEFHTVTVPDEDGTSYTFTAYFSGVGDNLRRIDDSEQTFWKSLTVNFTAQSPERTP